MVINMLNKIKEIIFGTKFYKHRKKSCASSSAQSIYSNGSNEKSPPKLPKSSLFRYATCCDSMLYVLAIFFSILSGCGIASYAIIVGEVVNHFVLVKDHTLSNFHTSLLFIGLMIVEGVVLFILSFIQYYIYHVVAVRIVSKIRCAYLKSLLYQELTFYDGDLSGLTNNIEKIRVTLSDKIGAVIRALIQLVTCLIASFLFCWQLSIALIIMIPFVVLWSELMSKVEIKPCSPVPYRLGGVAEQQ
uniref:ABC transmembrane type-1 domain-containing protein n=1 Tax=Acrobeloides nanus TaxID=290746 RepID=A0A914D427_9BILA